MPIHDFRCTECKQVHTELVSAADKEHQCPACGAVSTVVFLQAPKLDWYNMAMGNNAGPEFIDRFEKNHRKQKEKEERCLQEHGDYGASHGYDKPLDSE